MRATKPFLLGVWILIAIAVFKIIQLGFLQYFLNKRDFIPTSYTVFSFFNLFLISLPLLEAFIYWRLRLNISTKLWAHMHIWILFLAMVLLPLLMFVLAPFITINYSPSGNPNLYHLINNINYWSFWFFFSLAHIFFIVTIVKYFNRKSEVKENETPAGLLDEFIN
jgi:hypothetical protein